MKKWMAIMLIFSTVLFGSVFGFYQFKQTMIADFLANMPSPTMPVTAIEVSSSDWTPEIPAIGVVEPFQGVTLSSSEAGLVNKILFKSGEKVTKDQLLVELDLEVEKANLQASNSRLPAVKKDWQRKQQLYKKNSISKGDLDNAEAEYFSLIGQIKGLKAIIDRREIRAPFDGVVGLREINLGQYLQPGDKIVRLENMEVMLIRFIIPQKYISKIQLGMAITVDTDSYSDRLFIGSISAIEPVVDYNSGVVQVQASIPNSQGLLRSGMYGKVRIALPTLKEQLVIPQNAISFTLYGQSLYKINQIPAKEGNEAYLEAQQVTVEVAERRGETARVVKGIKAGDQIVTSGQIRLQNGARVRLVEDDTLALPDTVPML